MTANMKKDFNSSFNPPDSSDNFNILLFRLFRRADTENLKALQKGFPLHFQLFHGWKEFGIQYDNNELVAS